MIESISKVTRFVVQRSINLFSTRIKSHVQLKIVFHNDSNEQMLECAILLSEKHWLIGMHEVLKWNGLDLCTVENCLGHKRYENVAQNVFND